MNWFTFILFTTGSNIHHGCLRAYDGREAREKLEAWARENGYIIKRLEIIGITSKTFTLSTIPWYSDVPTKAD